MFNWSKLYAAKDKGGLALSGIDWYHLSFSLSQLSKIHLPPTRVPLWFRIEEKLVYPFSVEAFLSQTDRMVPSQDPILAFARESWKTAHQITKADPYLSSRSSIWYNKKLLIEKKSFFRDKWIKSGIQILEDVIEVLDSDPFTKLKINIIWVIQNSGDFYKSDIAFSQIKNILGTVKPKFRNCHIR